MTALPTAVDALRRGATRRAGRLGYYVAGAGKPLLLVHSINASASVYEMRPLFERMRHSHRVYAVDLPGYGFSERSDRRYDAPLFVDAVLDMLDVIAEDHPGIPVDVVALSLSGEFAVRAALRDPQRVRSLTLITPTGFQRGADKLRGPSGSTLEVPGLHAALRFRLWSSTLYAGLASRPSIRYFLERTFGSPAVPADLVDYAYTTSHQPGARFAPLAFLCFRLFSRDIRTLYESLSIPVWVPHATRGDFRDFSESAWTRSRPNWLLEPFDTGAMPHYEQPELFANKLKAFLAWTEVTPTVAPPPMA